MYIQMCTSHVYLHLYIQMCTYHVQIVEPPSNTHLDHVLMYQNA